MITTLIQCALGLFELLKSDIPDETLAMQVKVSVRDYIDEYESSAIITLDEWDEMCPNIVGLILFARSKIRS